MTTKQLKQIPCIVCIEGNIGAGKTTIINTLKQNNFKTIEEPVKNIWKQYLPIFYNNKKRWSFCFQMEILHWFTELQTIINTFDYNQLIIIERSALSAIEIFTKDLLENEYLSEWEYTLLLKFYFLIQWKPNYIIYLKCDPDIALNRIQKRNRKGESKINKKLITSLHQKHEELFQKPNKFITSTQQIIIIDANNTKENVMKQIMKELTNVMSNKINLPSHLI